MDRGTGFGQTGSGGPRTCRSGWGILPGELVAAAIGARGALEKPVARLLEESSEPREKVRSTSDKKGYKLPIDSIPVEGGELEIEVERLEFTNTKTGEKRHQAWITVGHSSNPTVINLPTDKVQRAYSTILHRISSLEYDARVVDGMIEIIPRDLDF